MDKNKETVTEDMLVDFFDEVGMAAPLNATITTLIHPETGKIDGVVISRKDSDLMNILPKKSVH